MSGIYTPDFLEVLESENDPSLGNLCASSAATKKRKNVNSELIKAKYSIIKP